MNRVKYFYTTAFLLLLISFTGCKVKATVTANSDLSSALSLELTQGAAFSNFLDTITAESSEVDLFSAKAIEEALKGSVILNAKVSSPKKYALSLSGTILQNQPLISRTDRTLSLNLTKTALQNIKASLPQETQNSLDMLMAPVFTEENMSIEEYTSLLVAVYGETLANELSSSTLDISLCPPKGKRITKGESNVSIPLMELLTLPKDRIVSISW